MASFPDCFFFVQGGQVVEAFNVSILNYESEVISTTAKRSFPVHKLILKVAEVNACFT